MDQTKWTDIDDYITGQLHSRDPDVTAILAANRAAGLPAIDVSEAQGKMLHLLARIAGARNVLEIGTLGGYSTIWLARAVGEGGHVTTLEYDPRHAAVARANFAHEGLSDRVTLHVGPALDTLPRLARDATAPFDFVFIDADKVNNRAYVEWAMRLSRKGTTIIVDNVVRRGAITDGNSQDPSVTGTRDMFSWMANQTGLTATGVQTVGAKGWDGFVLALVDEPLQ